MIDLRSDTVTKPTRAMREAAFEAEVGDDVYEEDPTVKKLENRAAELTGKEAALFVTSGTQGNQISVLTHCQPGDEVLMEANAHLFLYEGASMSALAGVQPRTLQGTRGAMNPHEVKAAIRPDDIHFPETGLICLENSHNKAGGAILPLENMQEIHRIAQESGIPLHLDGARLFNASVASGVPVKTYADQTDTIQFCLSKGLGAPVGSIIAGSEDFIRKARKWRKRLGGGLRQVGIIAAPGLVALNDMVDRLAEDHEHAKQLAEGLGNIEGLEIENNVDTNILLVNVEGRGKTSHEFLEELKSQGVLAVPFGPYTVRFVTHYDVSGEDIDLVIERVHRCL
ncbi:low-specificity L-threonine aldolase [Halobacillus halophilus]|uniref:Threonine aldolase n=1 Tax=Halobacillus halophilus (strain ATCC 35676 / DSM 2266 / JCM 20832 / KCTC 3685 / LMG 17431 / NBRC 102448 / NCIMB 2269) TaxID=866895 RepID=I0JTH6_HALH3|nr:low-specificity L-threonine aldolase [Halobacillus halophilus]ASF41357.1 low-specificity L-threonine aldolase [Halobacillus halophilus]CCG47449.1 threonine aldolase [Halobacillus halophilus DSM 2266]